MTLVTKNEKEHTKIQKSCQKPRTFTEFVSERYACWIVGLNGGFSLDMVFLCSGHHPMVSMEKKCTTWSSWYFVKVFKVKLLYNNTSIPNRNSDFLS